MLDQKPFALRASCPRSCPNHPLCLQVTTQTEFDETLAQLFGSGSAGGSSIDQMLADMDSRWNTTAGTTLRWVRRGRQTGQIRQQGHHRRLQPEGQTSTSSRCRRPKQAFASRIDGTLQPYIEVPAQFRQAMVPGKSCATWIFLKAQAARRQDQV
jgi:hypothetical protein